MSVGCRAIEVNDPVQGARIPMRVLYPAQGIEQVEKFGPYPLSVAIDAPIAGEGYPLIVLSHGSGSTPWVYRDLAAHLVRSGFVVAMPEHPGDTRRDGGLAGTPINLANRPRHVHRVIDAVLADPILAPRLAPAVAVVGHSMGGYTALAVAGGRPMALPNQTPDGCAHPVEVERDPRVRALVLLAPASPWFMGPGALAEVDVPIFMRTAELDDQAPSAFADIILRGVRDPSRITHRMIPGAGHFAFLSPFPPELTSPKLPPSQDPEGFDRAAFLPVLCADVEAFLRAVL